MLRHIFGTGLVFVCYILGEAMVRYFHLSVPGALVGLFGLFVVLSLLKSSWVEVAASGSQWMLKHMAVFFIPALSGVMLYKTEVITHWAALLLAVVLTTCLALGFSAWIGQRCLMRGEQ